MTVIVAGVTDDVAMIEDDTEPTAEAAADDRTDGAGNEASDDFRSRFRGRSLTPTSESSPHDVRFFCRSGGRA